MSCNLPFEVKFAEEIAHAKAVRRAEIEKERNRKKAEKMHYEIGFDAYPDVAEDIKDYIRGSPASNRTYRFYPIDSRQMSLLGSTEEGGDE